MRKVYEPKDVHVLVQGKIGDHIRSQLLVPFSQARQEAEIWCGHYLTETYTIDQIYDRLAELLHIDRETNFIISFNLSGRTKNPLC